MAADLLDVDDVVRRLAADARSRLPADAAAIWLLGPDGSELSLRAALYNFTGNESSPKVRCPFQTVLAIQYLQNRASLSCLAQKIVHYNLQ